MIESIRNEQFESKVSSVADELRIGPDYTQSHTPLILNDSSCWPWLVKFNDSI